MYAIVIYYAPVGFWLHLFNSFALGYALEAIL